MKWKENNIRWNTNKIKWSHKNQINSNSVRKTAPIATQKQKQHQMGESSETDSTLKIKMQHINCKLLCGKTHLNFSSKPKIKSMKVHFVWDLSQHLRLVNQNDVFYEVKTCGYGKKKLKIPLANHCHQLTSIY